MPTPFEAAVTAFDAAFRERPTVVGVAPARVELLGNHTDYHGGLILSAAIDRYTAVAGRPAEDQIGRVASIHFEGVDRFGLAPVEPAESGSWSQYVRGVCWSLAELAPIGGFVAMIAGDVPVGAGLSSSASLQAAFAMFLAGARRVDAAWIEADGPEESDPRGSARMTLARCLQRSENEFVGVGSGLMDQFSVLHGRADHALFLDCATERHDVLPLGDPAPAIVVCDSKTSRQLADGMYNKRRSESERVLAGFRDKLKDASLFSLSRLSPENLADRWDALDPVGRRRARHVLTENTRVRRGVEALKAGDVTTLGRLMSESHESSRDDFENSSPALEALIEAARAAPGFLGGKLSGAGWAGCTVNLVRPEAAAEFAGSVREGYHRAIGIEPEIHICRAAEAAGFRVL